jgi:hypothetical protein
MQHYIPSSTARRNVIGEDLFFVIDFRTSEANAGKPLRSDRFFAAHQAGTIEWFE